MKLDDLVSLIPQKGRQEQFLEMGRRYYDAGPRGNSGRDASPAPADEAMLDQLMEQIRVPLRAARHPIPTREELERMVREHFAARS